VPVAGIDLSESMVKELRKKPGGGGIPVWRGDMASTRAPGEFSLVYLVYNAITCLLTQDQQVACFRNAARHLRPGGRFVIEVFVPQLQRLPPGETTRAFHVGEHHLGFDTFDLANQRLISHHYWIGDGAARTFQSPHRFVWPSELDLMARLAGLELRERWADWNQTPFTAASTAHVSVWHKPHG
jgi:SAM-dependent methyltransferase